MISFGMPSGYAWQKKALFIIKILAGFAPGNS